MVECVVHLRWGLRGSKKYTATAVVRCRFPVVPRAGDVLEFNGYGLGGVRTVMLCHDQETPIVILKEFKESARYYLDFIRDVIKNPNLEVVSTNIPSLDGPELN